MARTYGTLDKGGGGRVAAPRSSGLILAAVAVAACVCVCVCVLTFVTPGGPRAVVLTDLQDNLPSAVQDMFSHVDIQGKKEWMRNIAQLAKDGNQLHPLADPDVFHNSFGDGTSHEAVIIHKGTQATVVDVEHSAKAEMDAAQQSARDAVGADAGCTHRAPNAEDYAGPVSNTAAGVPCMSWSVAFLVNHDGDSTFDPDLLTSLTANQCRNPGGFREGAWCYVDSNADPTLTHGQTWDYCNVGSRCGVDMPILHQFSPEPKGGALKSHKTKATKQHFAHAGAQAGMSHKGMTGKQAREALASSMWLVLDKNAGKIDKHITSYISASAARQQLVAEGLDNSD